MALQRRKARTSRPGARLPFDLRALETFLAVCETGGMAAAARRLGMTQPAVSQAVADIEARAGAMLFDRKVRPLGLTPAGVMLRQRASALLADAAQIAPMLRQTRRLRFPLIRIGLVDSLSRSFAGDLAGFLAGRADEVSIQSGLTALHATAFFTRRLDIIIGVDELIEVDGLERWPILEEPYVVLRPARFGRPAAAADLDLLAKRGALVRFSARSKTGAEIDQHLRRLRLDIPRRLEFDTPFGVTAAVAAGLGWAITTPLCLMEAALPLNELRIEALAPPGLRRRLTLVAREGELGHLPGEIAGFAHETLQARAQAFIERSCPGLKDQIFVGPKGY
jgi:DNA-binding transcriptional LysR family regulator